MSIESRYNKRGAINLREKESEKTKRDKPGMAGAWELQEKEVE